MSLKLCSALSVLLILSQQHGSHAKHLCDKILQNDDSDISFQGVFEYANNGLYIIESDFTYNIFLADIEKSDDPQYVKGYPNISMFGMESGEYLVPRELPSMFWLIRVPQDTQLIRAAVANFGPISEYREGQRILLTLKNISSSEEYFEIYTKSAYIYKPVVWLKMEDSFLYQQPYYNSSLILDKGNYGVWIIPIVANEKVFYKWHFLNHQNGYSPPFNFTCYFRFALNESLPVIVGGDANDPQHNNFDDVELFQSLPYGFIRHYRVYVFDAAARSVYVFSYAQVASAGFCKRVPQITADDYVKYDFKQFILCDRSLMPKPVSTKQTPKIVALPEKHIPTKEDEKDAAKNQLSIISIFSIAASAFFLFVCILFCIRRCCAAERGRGRGNTSTLRSSSFHSPRTSTMPQYRPQRLPYPPPRPLRISPRHY